MPKTILVVDDEPIVVEISKRKLEQHGYAVQTALNSLEAFQSLKSPKPDLILLDIQMPQVSGYTFLMEKDKIPEFAEIPVVVLTAYNDMIPVFERHNIKASLLKPLKLQDLIDKVTEIIGQP